MQYVFAFVTGLVAVREGTRGLVARDGGASTGRSAADWKESIAVRACHAPALSLPEQALEAMEAVVVVKGGSAVGSGVIVSPEGFVATAAPVVGDRTTVRVRLRLGLELEGRVLRREPPHDVALVRIPGEDLPCRAFSRAQPRVGSGIVAIGAPGGEALEYSLSRGVVSGWRDFDGYSFVQTDATLNPGNSGGPLLDERGAIVGIVSGKVVGRGFEGLGFGVTGEAWTERLAVSWGGRSAARESAPPETTLP